MLQSTSRLHSKMFRYLLVVGLVLASATTFPNFPNRTRRDKVRRGPIIWQEEFDYLDYGKWQRLITGWRGGNNEFQYYTDRNENSYVRDGILYIKPTLTADRFGEDFLYSGTLNLWNEGCNIDYDGGCYLVAGNEIINPIQSARMRTSNSFSFTHGYVEVRAKMPRGDWIWPAIWLLPTEEAYGGWPRSGEIDIVEVRGNNDFSCGGYPLGNKLMSSALHWGPDPGRDVYKATHWERVLQNSDFAADFHLFGLEKTPTYIKFFLDNGEIGAVYPPSGGFWEMGGFNGHNLWSSGSQMAPFDRPFHFVLNVAVGGNFFPDGCRNSPFPKPWNAGDPTQMRSFWERRGEWLPTWNAQTEDNAMQVDYIRVYSY